MAEEQAMVDAGHHDGGVEEIEGVPPQIIATPGLPERQAVGRPPARVRETTHPLRPNAQAAIRDDLEGYAQVRRVGVRRHAVGPPLSAVNRDGRGPGPRSRYSSPRLAPSNALENFWLVAGAATGSFRGCGPLGGLQRVTERQGYRLLGCRRRGPRGHTVHDNWLAG